MILQYIFCSHLIASVFFCEILPSLWQCRSYFPPTLPLECLSKRLALPHLRMPPNSELALPPGTHTYTDTHSDRSGARQTSDVLPCCTTVWDLHSHYIPKPLSSTTPRRSSFRPGQPCPTVCAPAQTWLTPSIHSILLHISHTLISLIICLWMYGVLGLTADSPPSSLPSPSARRAQGKREE